MLKYIVAAFLLAVSLATGNAKAAAQGQPHEAGAAKKVKTALCYKSRNPKMKDKCRFTPEARGERG